MDTTQTAEPTPPGTRPRPFATPVEDAHLVGRTAELVAIQAFLDTVAAGCGGALVLRGDTGSGKSALLAAAGRRARDLGATVMLIAGDAARADVAYGALACLLPVVRAVGNGPPPDRVQIRTATLAALRAAGGERTLLILVDDVQDLDDATATTLAFAARRLAGTRVGLLVAMRVDDDPVIGPAGLPQLMIAPLDDTDATHVVQDRAPGLPTHLVRRVVAESGGNPLALRELAIDLVSTDRIGGSTVPVPDSRSLERSALRIRQLTPGTQQALRVAATAGGDRHRLVVPDILEPAERAGVIEIDRHTGDVHFRHPLGRSIVHHLATPAERRTAHRTLAQLLVDRPVEHVTHLAAATAEPDERLARLVQRAAWRTLDRGDAAAAVAALVRAAQLSRSGPARSRRLAAAASVAAHGTGDLASVPRLLTAARRADPDHNSMAAAVAQAHCLLNGDGQVVAAHRVLVAALTDESNRESPSPAVMHGLHLLLDAASSAGCPDLWASVQPFLRLRGGDRLAGLRLRASVLADPARVSRRCAVSLDEAIRRLGGEHDPTRITHVAALALALDRVAECREPLRRVLEAGRAGRAVPAAIASYSLLCAGDVASGRWAEATEIAEEGIVLCEHYGHRLAAVRLRLELALLAAARGDAARTRLLVDGVTDWAAPRGLQAMVEEGRRVLSFSALGLGDAEGAYRHATALTRPGLLVGASPAALRVSMDLVEAAVRLGRCDEAIRHVQAMREAPLHAVSTRFAMLTAASAALIAEPDAAGASFDEALASRDADRWPFEQARIQLAYGEHLRRQRRTDQSRVHLSAALDTFMRLAAQPWAARARHALRATGVNTGRPAGPGAVHDLTADERAVATLAAGGLTNKQIARQLMVSHHTVAARLYQVFPKLGVGSRTALRDAMLALDAEAGRSDSTAALSGIA